jgi:hypothetical protein
MTTADLSSGLPASKDFTNLEQPAGQPRFGENQAFWIHDEASGLQICGHLNTSEDIGDYGLRLCKLSITFPDGRLYFIRELGNRSTSETVGSGNMRFTCVEPFKVWRCQFDGALNNATVLHNYRTGKLLDTPPVAVHFDVTARMAAPAWIQGSLTEGGLGIVTPFIGGERYEQVFEAKGTLTIDGIGYPVDGFGNRTHRYGVRDLGAAPSTPPMLGHVWAAAIFPDGTGFGFQIYPTAEGGILWQEAHVVRDGRLVPAKVIRAPWLRSYRTHDETFSFEFETMDGERYEVSGTTLASVLTMMVPAARTDDQVILSQSQVRYEMRGQSAINMMERSLRRFSIETGRCRPES